MVGGLLGGDPLLQAQLDRVLTTFSEAWPRNNQFRAMLTFCCGRAIACALEILVACALEILVACALDRCEQGCYQGLLASLLGARTLLGATRGSWHCY